MFAVANYLKRFALTKIGNAHVHTRTKSFQLSINYNFSSRIRRKRPSTGKITKSMEDEALSEKQRQKTEFQVKDMLESAATGIFIPRNERGEEVTMGEYLKFATLSPWVPCPDAVARRVLDIGNACEDDVHYELGSGDGRMNFFAIDLYNVKKSVGIDIDPSLVSRSIERIAKRHPAPGNLSFECADLIDKTNPMTNDLWDRIGEECTLLTMYFVEDALAKLKPLLEKHLLGKKCKILTVGYEINGWEPKWAEIVLGLTIHMYDMENLDDLYNRQTAEFQVSQDDVELNRKSRQALIEQNKDFEAKNPFSEQRLKGTDVQEESYDMDFDENMVYPDDDVRK